MASDHRASLTRFPAIAHYLPPFAPLLPTQELNAVTSAPSDAPYVCVRINRSWLPFIIGAIEALADERIYKPAPVSPLPMIQRVVDLQMMLALGNMNCEGEPIMLRQSPTDDCILQQSLDGGLTWINAFDFGLCRKQGSVLTINYNTYYDSSIMIDADMTVYAGDITNIAPEWEYGDENDDVRDEVLCYAVRLMVQLACETAIDAIHKSEQERIDKWRWVQDIGEKLASIASVLVSVGLIAEPAFWIGLAAAAAAAAIDIAIDEGLMAMDTSVFEDEEAREEVRCYLYCHIKGETPDFATWTTALDNDDLGGNAAAIADALDIMLGHEEFYVEWLKTIAALIEISEVGELPCACEPCPVTWYHEINLRGGIPAYVDLTKGTYYAGAGILSVDEERTPDRYYRFLAVTVNFPVPATWTKILLTFTRQWGTWYNNATTCEYFQVLPDGTIYSHTPPEANAGTEVSTTWTGNAAATTINNIFMACSRDTHPHYTGTMVLHSIELWGTGDNPFA